MAVWLKISRFGGASPIIACSMFLVLLTIVLGHLDVLGTWMEAAASASSGITAIFPIPGAVATMVFVTIGIFTLGGPGIGAFAPLLVIAALVINAKKVMAAITTAWAYPLQLLWTYLTLQAGENFYRYLIFWTSSLITSWGMGYLMRAFLDYSNRHLAEKLADQRHRIARDLHDTVAYSLSLIVMRTEQARLKGMAEIEDLVFVGQTAERSIRELRGMMALLRSEVPDVEPSEIWHPAPVAESLASETARLKALGFKVSVQVEGDVEKMPHSIDDAMSKAIHEGANNIAKHAEPKSGCAFMISVSDTDAELVMTNAPRKKTVKRNSHMQLGLVGMRERAVALGGEFSAGPGAERWITRMSLPTI